MTKRILFLFACFCLFMTQSGFPTAAQATGSLSGAKRGKQALPNSSAKAVSPAKLAGLQRILRAKNQTAHSNNLGDPCDEAVAIALGQTINGALATTDCLLDDGTYIDFYTFNGTSGQAVSISQSSTSFDTFLYLLDAEGNVVDFNDDSGEGTNSRIPVDAGVITLPFTGQYIIGANSYDEGVTGNYTVSLNTDSNCNPASITYNQTVNGTLAATDCNVGIGGEIFYTDLYRFNGTAGQQISIAMNSAAVDSFLILHTPSGEGSLENDNGGGGSNARIPAGSGTFTLPESGVYTIEASTFNSAETGAYTLILTGPATNPVPARRFFDYDGDARADISVFRPAEGTWYISNSSNGLLRSASFGLPTDRLVPADYDGDGKTDIAVYRDGFWYRIYSLTNQFVATQFGSAGDIPVPADFDADNKADLAVFRPSEGNWYRVNSSSGQFVAAQFGTNGDKPLIGDFDGDGKADLAVFRSSSNTWYIQRSGDNSFFATVFGTNGDIPVPADYDGDGKTDVSVYRPSAGDWYRINSTNNQFTGIDRKSVV